MNFFTERFVVLSSLTRKSGCLPGRASQFFVAAKFHDRLSSMHVMSFHDFDQKFLLLTQEVLNAGIPSFNSRNPHFGKGQVKRCWGNLSSRLLERVLIAFMDRGRCICSIRASFLQLSLCKLSLTQG